jgi:hypothetical protein
LVLDCRGGVAFVAKTLIFGGQFTAIRNLWTIITKGAAAVGGYGFLKMKRWAVYLYFSFYAINTAILYTIPPSQEVFEKYTEPSSLWMLVLIPTGIALLMAKYWRRFT